MIEAGDRQRGGTRDEGTGERPVEARAPEGDVILKNVRITGKDKSPMILLPMVKAVIFPSDLAARDFRLAALEVRDPEIDVSRDRSGEIPEAPQLHRHGEGSPRPGEEREAAGQPGRLPDQVKTYDVARRGGSRWPEP